MISDESQKSHISVTAFQRLIQLQSILKADKEISNNIENKKTIEYVITSTIF
jgi:hypothetical protein